MQSGISGTLFLVNIIRTHHDNSNTVVGFFLFSRFGQTTPRRTPIFSGNPAEDRDGAKLREIIEFIEEFQLNLINPNGNNGFDSAVRLKCGTGGTNVFANKCG
ncbi:PREDICTED: uncharacterized protein LOC104736787 [Camelina sativa]|uniref:Uncharacterized protein LOC104736787 n=1 Tax=Camelina sativa TaxID=90675 RepID=A0ABM1QTE3_CAMSA|nr:PREDICTED: uncharacterized protein LOC104736787 [Camelina sativa]